MDRLRASCPTRLLKQSKLKQLAQDHVQLGLEYLHRCKTPQLLWAKLMKGSLLQLPTSTHSVATTFKGSTGNWFYHLILLPHQVPPQDPHQDLLWKSELNSVRQRGGVVPAAAHQGWAQWCVAMGACQSMVCLCPHSLQRFLC